MDMVDLDFHESGSSVDTIADYLCRTVEEVLLAERVQSSCDHKRHLRASPVLAASGGR
jgi:hypothetical protein